MSENLGLATGGSQTQCQKLREKFAQRMLQKPIPAHAAWFQAEILRRRISVKMPPDQKFAASV